MVINVDQIKKITAMDALFISGSSDLCVCLSFKLWGKFKRFKELFCVRKDFWMERDGSLRLSSLNCSLSLGSIWIQAHSCIRPVLEARVRLRWLSGLSSYSSTFCNICRRDPNQSHRKHLIKQSVGLSVDLGKLPSGRSFWSLASNLRSQKRCDSLTLEMPAGLSLGLCALMNGLVFQKTDFFFSKSHDVIHIIQVTQI